MGGYIGLDGYPVSGRLSCGCLHALSGEHVAENVMHQSLSCGCEYQVCIYIRILKSFEYNSQTQCREVALQLITDTICFCVAKCHCIISTHLLLGSHFGHPPEQRYPFQLIITANPTCTCMLNYYNSGRALCLEYRVSWVRVPPEAAHFFYEK